MKSRHKFKIQVLVPLILLVVLVSSCENETAEDPGYSKTPFADTIRNSNSSFSIYIVGKSVVTGTGEIMAKELDVSEFSEIELKKIGNVTVSKGTEYKVEVSDYENLIDLVKLSVISNRLIIGYSDTCVKNSKLKVRISMPETLNTVALSGSGCVDIFSEFDNLSEFSITGNGNIITRSTFTTSDLYVNLEGAGQIFAAGTTTNLTVDLTGIGNVNLSGLTAEKADCMLSGNGNINLAVTSSLKAFITGTGNIVYFGNPLIEQNITGTGFVTKGN